MTALAASQSPVVAMLPAMVDDPQASAGGLTPENIKAARERLGWTQAELGKKVGVGWRTVAGYEAGDHMPRARSERERQLAQVLGLSIEGSTPAPQLGNRHEVMRALLEARSAIDTALALL